MRIHFLAPWPWPLTFLSDGLDQIENGKWLLRIKLTTWTVSVISSEERGSQKYGHRNVLVITDDKVGRTEDSRCQRLPPHWRRCCSSVPTVTPRRCQTRQSWQLRRLGRRLVFARRHLHASSSPLSTSCTAMRMNYKRENARPEDEWSETEGQSKRR